MSVSTYFQVFPQKSTRNVVCSWNEYPTIVHHMYMLHHIGFSRGKEEKGGATVGRHDGQGKGDHHIIVHLPGLHVSDVTSGCLHHALRLNGWILNPTNITLIFDTLTQFLRQFNYSVNFFINVATNSQFRRVVSKLFKRGNLTSRGNSSKT